MRYLVIPLRGGMRGKAWCGVKVCLWSVLATGCADPAQEPSLDGGRDMIVMEDMPPVAQDMPADLSVTPDEGVTLEVDMMPVEDMAADLVAEDLGEEDMPLEDMSPEDMSPEPPKGVPIFVAQGRMGRTLVGCEGGTRWVADRNMAAEGHRNYCGVAQPSAECNRTACQQLNNKSECVMEDVCACSDHQVGSPVGLGYGDGWFISMYGHGAPPTVWRSQDGVSWEEVSQIGGQDVAFGNGVIAIGSGVYGRSVDHGATWDERDRMARPNVGIASLIHYSPSKDMFIYVGRTGTAKSVDGGVTWVKDESWDVEQCSGNYARHMVQHGDTILFTRGNGGALMCISRDGGETFTPVLDAINAGAGATHDGTLFHLWSSRQHYTSPDGETWAVEDLVGGRDLRGIAYDPVNAIYVAVSGGNFETQHFFRSEDGTTWTQVPDEHISQGAQIKRIVFGYAPEGFVCPQ